MALFSQILFINFHIEELNMKNLTKLFVVCMTLLFPLLGLADGKNSLGRVTISCLPNIQVSMAASFNVRYNPAATSAEWVQLQMTSSGVQVAAQNATDTFVCSIPNASSLYPVALAAMSAGAGTSIGATYAVTGGQYCQPVNGLCSTFNFTQASDNLP